jgi:cyclopropane fatty-acyl-phospholipid synthase-like methyltransferase
MRRLFFWWRYATGQARWDTNVTPPEVVDLIERDGLEPGRAIDLGCGTGTNSIYLARHSWQVVGIDYVARPIRQARRKASRSGVGERTRFLVADVTRLDSLELDGPFDLALDIGCGHILTGEQQAAYATQLAGLMCPGGIFMLYMFQPMPGHAGGLTPDGVKELFAPEFRLAWTNLGEDTATSAPSAWYRLERTGEA